MTLTAIVGALVALVARPKPRLTPVIDPELDRHVVEALERELALAQAVLEHWRDEAQRLARENRERRGDMMQAAMAQQAQMNIAHAQQAQAQQLPRYAGAQQMQNFEGFCNCVPSRAQVWGGQHGLVQQLNTFLGD